MFIDSELGLLKKDLGNQFLVSHMSVKGHVFSGIGNNVKVVYSRNIFPQVSDIEVVFQWIP